MNGSLKSLLFKALAAIDADLEDRVKPVQAAQWCLSLSEIARSIELPEFAGLFYIRLYSVLKEALPYVTELANDASGTEKLLLEAWRDALLAMRQKLTKDECVLLTYLRDTQCHFAPGAYYHRLLKDGNVRFSRRFDIIGEDIDLLQVKQILKKMISPVVMDDTPLAVGICSKVLPDMINVMEGLEALGNSTLEWHKILRIST